MATGFQTFRQQFDFGIGDWVDIYGSATFNFDGGDNVNGDFIQGKSLITGGFFFVEVIGNQSDCFFAADQPAPPTPPPDNAEPPFPPVWPYPLQNIYQREFWSMDVHMIRADTKIWDLFIFQDEARLDLTDKILRFTAKWDYFDSDSAAVIKLDNSGLGGIVVTNSLQGEATLTIPKTATDIPAIPYHRTILFYDIKIQFTNGEEHTIARGRLIINPNATTAI